MNTQAATKTDLLLLGLLMDRPMHGYELFQQIQAEGIDAWFNVSAAGVYYSLRKLRDQGLVAESRQGGGRSSRKSIYRLTEKGRSAFFSAMEAQLASQERTHLDYDIGIYLLNRLPLQRALPRLEEHRAFLSEQVQDVQSALDAEQDDGRYPLRLAVLDHRRRFLEMEQDWLADVMGGLQEDGEGAGSEEVARRGLMILSGDLRQYHLPDLVRLIVSGEHTGTLTIANGSRTGTLSFKSGQPAYASCVCQGVAPGQQPTLDQALDTLCEVFRQQEGRFTFDQRMDHQDGWLPLEISAEELILRGCRKVDSWAIIQRFVPSASTIFEPGSGVQSLDCLAPLPVEERVLAAVDGISDVETIASKLELTLFEASRVFYCLCAIGVVRTADLDKIRLRRVFREIAELMCSSTVAWRPTPDDRACEQAVNRRTEHLPIRLVTGRIEDLVDPQLGIDHLTEVYGLFLREQFTEVSHRFGYSAARQSYERTLEQLAPELQDVASRYGFDQLPA